MHGIHPRPKQLKDIGLACIHLLEHVGVHTCGTLGVGVKMILKKELTEIISGNHPRPSAAITHLLEGQSVAISGNQWQSVAITHLLEGVDAAGLRLLPRAIVGHATRRRAVGARHGARRRSGATLHCGLAGRCSLARLLCELGDARDHVEDSRVHLWGREGRRRGERRAPW